jgi:hypothetical protein
LYIEDAIDAGLALKPLRVISLFLSLRRAGASFHIGGIRSFIPGAERA